MTTPPAPARILRYHTAQIAAIHISGLDEDGRLNERLYSGDVEGHVVIISTRSFRPVASWMAHQKGILGIEEWGSRFISHGRDNKLHVWARPESLTVVAEMATSSDLPTPHLHYSLDVNALNFCRFSLLPRPDATEALVAVPNLVESSLADIWALSSRKRLHAAIGKVPGGRLSNPWNTIGRGMGSSNTGSMMSLHLYAVTGTSSNSTQRLRLLIGYENGGVALWSFDETLHGKPTTVEGNGWEALWQVKAHEESILGLTLNPRHDFAYSVSADHLVVRYDLKDQVPEASEAIAKENESRILIGRGKHPGNGAICARPDGKIIAVAGWDGRVRLYSAKTLKPLGTLTYHSGGCQALVFAHAEVMQSQVPGSGNIDLEELDDKDREKRGRWLISGGTDKRVAIWALMDFSRSQ